MAKRKEPGAAGAGRFYHIGIRPKGQFTSFRTQDVGAKGHIERLAGRRSSGSWGTVTWLVSKKDAHLERGRLVIDTAKARTILKQIRGPILHVEGDIFAAHPRNVPEKDKPTPAQQRAQKANIQKAQAARRKRSGS